MATATVCKLIGYQPQTVPEGSGWYRVWYDTVIEDDIGMFRGARRAGDPLSTVITPPRDMYGIWFRQVKWGPVPEAYGEPADHGQKGWDFHERFVRDPYGIADNTGESDGPDTVGQDLHLGGWPFFAKGGRQVAVEVRHNLPGPVDIVLAQYIFVTWDS